MQSPLLRVTLQVMPTTNVTYVNILDGIIIVEVGRRGGILTSIPITGMVYGLRFSSSAVSFGIETRPTFEVGARESVSRRLQITIDTQ